MHLIVSCLSIDWLNLLILMNCRSLILSCKLSGTWRSFVTRSTSWPQWWIDLWLRLSDHSWDIITSRRYHLAAFGLSKLKIVLLINSSIYLAHVLWLLIHSNSIESAWILNLVLMNLILIYAIYHVISCIVKLLHVLHLFGLSFTKTNSKLWSARVCS